MTLTNIANSQSSGMNMKTTEKVIFSQPFIFLNIGITLFLQKSLYLAGMSFIVIIVDTDKENLATVLSNFIDILLLFYLLDSHTRCLVMLQTINITVFSLQFVKQSAAEIVPDSAKLKTFQRF